MSNSTMDYKKPQATIIETGRVERLEMCKIFDKFIKFITKPIKSCKVGLAVEGPE